MAFHQIQCPQCFTDYTISDEQYHASDGVVRCGTCREQFKAIVVVDGSPPPKFDPRDVFIEPLSKPLAAAEGGDSYEKSVDPDEQGIELMSTHEFEYSGPKEPEVPKEVIEAYADSDELSTSEIIRNLRSKASDNSFTETISDTVELTNTDKLSTDKLSERSVSVSRGSESDATLIKQVDALVDKKLLGEGGANARANQIKIAELRAARARAQGQAQTPDQPQTTSTNRNDDELFLAPRRHKRKKKRGFFGLLGTLMSVLLVLLLIAALAYQLWLKQLIDLPTDNAWLNKIDSVTAPYREQAEEQLAALDINLPQRRNLSQLELLSAQTEPHPTRTTTVLLKVSVINRAKIAQPLPWLEMTLTDAEGRLVARRNLSPKSYIYNNKTNSKIGANELKKVTIELLSFPKSATGYEIKLLDNWILSLIIF